MCLQNIACTYFRHIKVLRCFLFLQTSLSASISTLIFQGFNMRKIHQSVLIAAFLFFCFGFMQIAWAGDDAFDAYIRKDYASAFRGLSLLAEQGNAKAQYGLGLMYANGQGVAKDEQQAYFWFRKAAEQGDASAQHSLGDMYSFGEGVPKDEQQAYFWWLLASAKGDESAKKNMGISEKTLPPQPRVQAQADARHWQPKTAEESPRDTAEYDSPAPKTKGEKLTGTGFVVSPNQIVTNVHVVSGCALLIVNGKRAAVRAMDSTNDLALLSVSLSSGVATLRAGNLRQGDEVNAVGYPLYGLLASGAQITSGT